MTLDWQVCSRARLSRDARFDGRLFAPTEELSQARPELEQAAVLRVVRERLLLLLSEARVDLLGRHVRVPLLRLLHEPLRGDQEAHRLVAERSLVDLHAAGANEVVQHLIEEDQVGRVAKQGEDFVATRRDSA